MTQPITDRRKRPYSTPLLTNHGDIDEITLKGGSNLTDIPMGTPVGTDTRPGDGGPGLTS